MEKLRTQSPPCPFEHATDFRYLALISSSARACRVLPSDGTTRALQPEEPPRYRPQRIGPARWPAHHPVAECRVQGEGAFGVFLAIQQDHPASVGRDRALRDPSSRRHQMPQQRPGQCRIAQTDLAASLVLVGPEFQPAFRAQTDARPVPGRLEGRCGPEGTAVRGCAKHRLPPLI